uniref:DNA-directed RNA polymerase subunit n=1 Tax=Microrhizoidea pickettheapsiorum TaxID=2604950 RepID=A0A5B9RGP9_9CHLO|nr:RNA polymerase b'-subunit [Microrhizoidea pickettheapsiorum]QEG77676.1 RNA polymerase b'-subunit [Microrhizoidea pickettheapsiorum]
MTKIFWPICFEKSFNFLIGVDQSPFASVEKYVPADVSGSYQSHTVRRLVSSYSIGFYTSRASRDKCFWKIANLWFFFHYSLNCFFSKKQQNLDSKIFFSKELFLFRLKWARFQLLSNRRLLPPNLKSQKGFLLQKNWVEHEYRLFRRLKILQRFEIGRNTENILLKFLPVLPPTLRPLMQMSDGFLVSSDLNDLYLHVLRRKNRFLRILMKSNSVPLRVLIGDYGLVQQSIDVLLENGRVGKMEKKSYPTSRALKSLTDFIQGKQGRFRHNLLGKRVDYSARSVIIVGPKLRISQCGLPREIALKLFYPFILKFLLRIKKVKSVFAAKIFIEKHSKLVPKKKFYFPGLGTKNDQSPLASLKNYVPAGVRGSYIREKSHTVSNGVKQAKQKMFERKKEIADSMQFWNFIQKVIGNHPILLNRAPTLHRLGIQAFFPVLVPGRAIQLHPLVCPTFNADFDGDQMGVHLPLSIQAQCESRLLMLSSHNWLSPATGQPNLLPSQDMVLGFYYLTTPVHNSIPYIFFQKKIHFIHAFEQNQIGLHTSVWLKWEGAYENTNKQEFLQEIIIHSSGQTRYLFDFSFYFEDTYAQKLKKYIRTTAGRVYFNQLF